MRVLERVETWLLCLLLSTMVLLACLQIGLRTFFSSGLLWADPLLRYLVLWCGFLGAVTATSQSKHIVLDLLTKLLPGRLVPLVDVVCELFCLLVTSWLAWAAISFLRQEIHYGGPGLLGLPSWFWDLIFPLTFGLMAGKYLIRLSVGFRRLFTVTIAAQPPAP